jgi:hypothetical protein
MICRYLAWRNRHTDDPSVVPFRCNESLSDAAVAAIHPFEDGNRRTASALSGRR